MPDASPPSGVLIRFKAPDAGWYVGTYFSAAKAYFCATSNRSWPPDAITEWEPVLVLPITTAEVPEALIDHCAAALDTAEHGYQLTRGRLTEADIAKVITLAEPAIAARARAQADTAALERAGRVLDAVLAAPRRTAATQQFVERLTADLYAALQRPPVATEAPA